MTALMAYPLSKPHLRFRNQIMFLIVLTMVFHPGMIPNFLNVKDMGLYNSIWSLIIPGLIGPYNLILIKIIISHFRNRFLNLRGLMEQVIGEFL